MSTYKLTTLLTTLANSLSVSFFDLRGALPEHRSKRFSTRETADIIGSTYHHSAMSPIPAVSSGEADLVLDLAVQKNEKRNGNKDFRVAWRDEQYVRAIKRIADYHVGPNHISNTGAPGICYTMAVDPLGGIYLLHDLNRCTWSQGDSKTPGSENRKYLGVLFMGDFSSDSHIGKDKSPTAMQIAVAALLPAVLKESLPNYRMSRATGHADFHKAACPGRALYEVVQCIRRDGYRTEISYDINTWSGRQEVMNAALSMNLTVDNKFGPRTKAAVVELQTLVGVTADGKWGAKTTAAVKVYMLKNFRHMHDEIEW